MSKIVNALAKDYLRSLIIGFGAVAIILPLGCLCLYLPLTIASSAGTDDGTAVLLVVASTSCFFLSSLAAVSVLSSSSCGSAPIR